MLDLGQSVAYADSNDFETSKRAPSGFMGMRGKKATGMCRYFYISQFHIKEKKLFK